MGVPRVTIRFRIVGLEFRSFRDYSLFFFWVRLDLFQFFPKFTRLRHFKADFEAFGYPKPI